MAEKYQIVRKYKMSTFKALITDTYPYRVYEIGDMGFRYETGRAQTLKGAKRIVKAAKMRDDLRVEEIVK